MTLRLQQEWQNMSAKISLETVPPWKFSCCLKQQKQANCLALKNTRTECWFQRGLGLMGASCPVCRTHLKSRAFARKKKNLLSSIMSQARENWEHLSCVGTRLHMVIRLCGNYGTLVNPIKLKHCCGLNAIRTPSVKNGIKIVSGAARCSNEMRYSSKLPHCYHKYFRSMCRLLMPKSVKNSRSDKAIPYSTKNTVWRNLGSVMWTLQCKIGH